MAKGVGTVMADGSSVRDDLLELQKALTAALDRIEVLVARTANQAPPAERIGNFVLDRVGHRVMVDDKEVPLAIKEFAVLSYLVEKAGRMVTYEELTEQIWGTPTADLTRKKSLHVHIRWLREKLDGRVPFRIVTVKLGGYRLDRLDQPTKMSIGSE